MTGQHYVEVRLDVEVVMEPHVLQLVPYVIGQRLHHTLNT